MITTTLFHLIALVFHLILSYGNRDLASTERLLNSEFGFPIEKMTDILEKYPSLKKLEGLDDDDIVEVSTNCFRSIPHKHTLHVIYLQ